MPRSAWRLASLTALACAGFGCSPEGDPIVNQIVDDDMPASGNIVAITTSDILFHVHPARPDRVLHSAPVVGLDADDSVLSLDRRSADGQLYAWTLQRRLYLVDCGAENVVATFDGVPIPAGAGVQNASLRSWRRGWSIPGVSTRPR